MKTKITMLMLLVCAAINAQTVKVSASEPDANIIVNGQQVAVGTYKLKIER